MPKTKRTIIPLLFILLILAVVFFLILHKPTSPAEPLKAVPLNAMFVVQVNDFRSLYEQTAGDSRLWEALKGIPGFGKMDAQLRFLDSLYRTVPMVEEILKHGPSFLSAHLTGKDHISILHVIGLPERYGDKSIGELAVSLAGSGAKHTLREYEGVTLHQVETTPDGAGGFTWAVSRENILVSLSSLLVEDAIRQLQSGESLSNLKGFPEIYATAGKNVDANVFVNFSRFPQGAASWVAPAYRNKVRAAAGFADWAGMDLNLMNDMVLMNGFILPPDSVASISGLFAGQSPQKITSDQVLPASTGSFLTLAFSDPETWLEAYRSYLQSTGRLSAYDRTLRTLGETLQTDVAADFAGMIDGEITLAYDTPASETDSVKPFIVMRVKSQGLAQEKMNRLLEKAAEYASVPLASCITQYRLDSEVSFAISHIPLQNLVSAIFGPLFSVVGEQYYTFSDNYLIIGPSVTALQSLLHSRMLNKTLEFDATYSEFRNNLTPRSNILFYSNLSKSRAVWSPYLKTGIARDWVRFTEVFRQVPVAGFQMIGDERMLYCNVVLKYLSSYSGQTQTVWESRLDTLASCKPVFVVNHQTRENEVFVQDLSNNIYLINQVGRVLWKQQLPEQINSEIFQVDYFRNGKLQLLFSTRDHLYLIDRKGNNVEKYPVKLRAPATSGLTVFDYDNNREYRLFIACEDRKVYAYTREGALVNGWSFREAESEVTRPLNHFRLGNKDFLVFGDRFRTYILDRKGNTRISTEAFFPRSANNGYFIHKGQDGQGTAVVTTDTTGTVYFIGFDGSIKTVDLDRYSGRHFFEYRDIDGNGSMEYIFLDGDRLTVYGSDQKRLFTRTFPKTATRPVFYQFSLSNIKLGVACPGENQIYLYNNDGELYTGFPLQGNTPYSIGNFGDTLSKFNLVVGSRDNFLYNYRVK